MCTNLDFDWEDNFLEDIVQPDQDDEETDLESDRIEDVEDISPFILNTHKEAIVALENVQKFFEVRGHGKESSTIATTIDSCIEFKLKRLSQSTLNEFF